MPAVALTDHGSLAGAVDLYKAAGKQGVKPILGCEVYVAEDRRSRTRGYAHLTLLAESNDGYANLIKLSSLGYLEGYYTKPRVDWELLETYAPGLIALSGCLSGRVCKALEENRPADARADLDRLAQVFGRDSTYVELQNAGLDVQQRVNPRARQARRRGEAAARRHRRRPLPDGRGRVLARGAPLHPVRRLAQEPGPLALRHERVLLQVPRRDGARLPGARGRDAAHARGRRAVQRQPRARRRAPAAVPDAGGPRRLRLPARAVREGPRAALRQGDDRAARAAPVRAEDDQGDGLRRLLPDRLGLHPLREDERDQRRPRPRLGRRLARRVLPADHRRRPDALRAALRALPQPGPRRPARHGHRFLGRRPRAGDQLRRREVRPRPRRPDHHLRDDGRARRRPRRRPRARDPLRRRRPDREADPGRAGPDPDGVPQVGRAEDGVRHATRSRRRSSTSRSRSKGSCARTRSTPPASSSAPSR